MGTTDQARVVREALEKIESTGEIGTVNLPRCILYMRDIESDSARRSAAISAFKELVLELD